MIDSGCETPTEVPVKTCKRQKDKKWGIHDAHMHHLERLTAQKQTAKAQKIEALEAHITILEAQAESKQAAVADLAPTKSQNAQKDEINKAWESKIHCCVSLKASKALMFCPSEHDQGIIVKKS